MKDHTEDMENIIFFLIWLDWFTTLQLYGHLEAGHVATSRVIFRLQEHEEEWRIIGEKGAQY